ANRPFTNDVVSHEGTLDIRMSPLMRRFRWLLRLTGVLVPFEGNGVRCVVYTKSQPTSKTYVFERHFFPTGGAEYVFRSELVCVAPHVVIEYFAFGGGWKATYTYDGERVRIEHAGFAWRVFGKHVPLPGWLAAVFGVGAAFELATATNRYTMRSALSHKGLGQTLLSYEGEFTVTGVTLDG
ncbi:MAG: DUF4166 domain-containing protein, partial [Asticcacaulis sp.]|nr:DUF4166 domain-containing protein [Asticcacaulis sp.]